MRKILLSLLLFCIAVLSHANTLQEIVQYSVATYISEKELLQQHNMVYFNFEKAPYVDSIHGVVDLTRLSDIRHLKASERKLFKKGVTVHYVQLNIEDENIRVSVSDKKVQYNCHHYNIISPEYNTSYLYAYNGMEWSLAAKIEPLCAGFYNDTVSVFMSRDSIDSWRFMAKSLEGTIYETSINRSDFVSIDPDAGKEGVLYFDGYRCSNSTIWAVFSLVGTNGVLEKRRFVIAKRPSN